MCGVIGVHGHAPVDLIRNLFIETQIRGRHATGVSYWKNDKVNTIKEPIPAEEFLDKYNPEDWYECDSITMIGHCRYSTSDLQYNQPIANDTRAIVHNGVITQSLPETWKKTYGYKCEGKNDTELLFHSWNPKEWEDSSIACIMLENDSINWYRNGKRPLWQAETNDYRVITSTKDIAIRSGLHPLRININGVDLQP